MSGTVKTVLIVGGVAAGMFVLAKALAPKAPPPASKTKSITDLVSLQGLLAAAGGLGSLFSGRGNGPSAPGVDPAHSDAASMNVLKNFDRSNMSVQSGFMFTDDSGNFIAG